MTENAGLKGAFTYRPSTASATYKAEAYDRIKDAILYHRMEAGALYSQESICSELGINRTPVREALLELQKEGLVSYSRSKGVRVLPVTQTEAHNILEARIFLEKTSAQLAAQRASIGELSMLKTSLESTALKLDCGDSCLLYRIDHQFHRLIADMTHNAWLARIIEQILDQYLRFEDLDVYLNQRDARLILEEHTRIYEAIASHDPQRAEESIYAHLNNSYSRTVHKFWA